MNVFFVLTSSLFLSWSVRDIFFWVNKWQENEYRFDRLAAFLNKKKQKKLFIPSLLIGIKWFLFLSFFIVQIGENLYELYHYAIGIFFIFQSFILIKEIYHNKLRKPILNMKAILILFLTLVIVILLFSFPLLDKFFWLLFLELLIPVIVAFFVFLLSFPTELYSDIQVEKATKKLRMHKNLLVIGVTGSYGKSLAKEFIAHILTRKFRVIKTKDTDNTALGIARTVLQNLKDDTQIFVVEMSAYKKGEIRELCHFIRPKIGVLTAINNQHLPLFKSFENIKETNFELLTSIPNSSFCLINGDNKYSYQLSTQTTKQKIIYRSKIAAKVKKNEKNIIASNIIHKRKSISFDVDVQNTNIHLNARANHKIEYLLPGIYLALYLGISPKQIQKAVATFK